MKRISQTAKNYAISLLNSEIDYNELLNEFSAVWQVIKDNENLSDIINNPSINENLKYEIIDEIFKNKTDEYLVNFLKLIIEKKRFSLLEEIKEALITEVNKKNNVQSVTVVSAIELSQTQKQRIVEKLQNKLSKNIVSDWEVNTDIIGGLIFKFDDNVIDDSLKEKLRKYSKI